ncbi:DUF2339 domain-containing protein [Pontiella sulfatireligans]|uniref:DUF2339 domain-containing protein n=1 Tax=Pontiella sulfatireligans TaxID=2750658 RepID=A0A6C2UGA5_9BACT|nr:DUF2339 domain-containing protein [Pontiella sulfatireligans]VGO18404.1 hypothetical protein SCARR_00457 [Pontiella sulfatireligans]
MVALMILMGLLFLAAPIVALIALVKVGDAKMRIEKCEQQINFLTRALAEQLKRSVPDVKPEEAAAAEAIPPKEHVAPPVIPASIPHAPAPRTAEAPPPKPEPVVPLKPAPEPLIQPKPKKNMEEALGGKVSGVIGVLILVAGIAFLVGSPEISWPAPLFKILMGVALGGTLLACGHIANKTASGKFVQLARVMTGGGGGLFYFCIFASYDLYHLSGPLLTALSLSASAALLLFLALSYNSQLVAALGVLGAFITPLMVGGDIDQGVFPLAYIAVINLPVMILGIKKNWQVLYNSAYAFTVFYFFYWMGNINAEGWLAPLCATAVYFAEFMTLSLLILKKRDRLEPSNLNIARIAATTLFLFCSLYLIFYGASVEHWMSVCLVCVSAAFAGMFKLSWKWLPEYRNETLALLLCGFASVGLLIFEAASMEYRGILWSLQALAIARFFRNAFIFKIQLSSVLLSIIGGVALAMLMLSQKVPSHAWFNPDILLLLTGALVLGAASWILRLHTKNKDLLSYINIIRFGSFGLILLAAGNDLFVFDSMDCVPWMAATAGFAAVSLFCLKRSSAYVGETLHFTLAAILCFAIYLHMQLAGLWISAAWGLLGIGTMLFALKNQSKEIQNSALIIGFSALLHATLQPIQNDSNLILINPHTLCGLFAALTIGIQAKFYDRIEESDLSHLRTRALWMICVGAVLAIAYRNIFHTLSWYTPLPWLLTSLITLFMGNLVNWMLGTDPVLQKTGRLIIAALPLKILLLDNGIPWLNGTPPALTSYVLWVQVAMLIQIIWFSGRIKNSAPSMTGYFSLAPLITILAIISLAIGSLDIAWSWALVSIWWAVTALTITIFGFSRKSKLHRHFALLMFAATVVKVLLIDCSIFQAGARVMIFIGVGLLLLVLSFIYQKVSERLL